MRQLGLLTFTQIWKLRNETADRIESIGHDDVKVFAQVVTVAFTMLTYRNA